ncbi:PREDICTED: zinc finger protein 70-like [Priapulus caudatus]|uniref:Zinc finger protein 70-like n=1 Tax=Priapulus caudatus TaxID=37621 RepID=A0ABM1EWH0_PRICU|nr:PREDICTED: zinc finger protein 70-like [Priapulus caudatus]
MAASHRGDSVFVRVTAEIRPEMLERPQMSQEDSLAQLRHTGAECSYSTDKTYIVTGTWSQIEDTRQMLMARLDPGSASDADLAGGECRPARTGSDGDGGATRHEQVKAETRGDSSGDLVQADQNRSTSSEPGERGDEVKYNYTCTASGATDTRWQPVSPAKNGEDDSLDGDTDGQSEETCETDDSDAAGRPPTVDGAHADGGDTSDGEWKPRRSRRKGIPRKRALAEPPPPAPTRRGRPRVSPPEPPPRPRHTKRGRGRPRGARDRKPRVRQSEQIEDWRLAGTTYACVHCPFTTKHVVSIRKHVKRRHQHRPHACDFCPKNFAYKSDLRKHVVTHPAYEGRGGLKCPHCDRICVCRSHLRRHALIHTGENRTFTCPRAGCRKAFTSKHAVDVHVEIHTGGRRRPFLCSTCGKAFTTKNVLLEHENIHSNARPMKCEICDKGFNSGSSLRIHRMTHSTECRYVCEICSKEFKLLASLRMHQVVHSGKRAFVCTRCGKAFTQNSALQRHTRIHTGVKPYACKLCEKTFGDSSILRRHMSVHRLDGEGKRAAAAPPARPPAIAATQSAAPVAPPVAVPPHHVEFATPAGKVEATRGATYQAPTQNGVESRTAEPMQTAPSNHVDHLSLLPQAGVFPQGAPGATSSLYQTVMNIGQSSGIIQAPFSEYQGVNTAFMNTTAPHFYPT